MPIVLDGLIVVSVLSVLFGLFMLGALYAWACMHFGNDM